MRLQLNDEERHFLARWTLANIVGWGGGLTIGGTILIGVTFVAPIVPRYILLPILPLAGAVIGGIVGTLQWWALYTPATSYRWIWVSIGGGAVSMFPAAFFAALLSFNPLIARFIMGAMLAAGIGITQIFFMRDDTSPNWIAIRRWAIINAIAGILCAGISPAGQQFWLPLTCLIGTAVFGIITGTAMLRVQRASNH